MNSDKKSNTKEGPVGTVSHIKSPRKKRIEHWKIIALYLLLYDVVAVNAAYFMGIWLRFDLRYTSIPEDFLSAFFTFAPWYTLFSVTVFYGFRLYNSVWRFASFSELNRIFLSSGITTVFHIVGMTAFVRRMPTSYYVFGAMLQFLLITGIRFSYRYILLERARRERSAQEVHKTMIIGAGAAGQVILRELKNSKETDAKPCCLIDDNSNKWGRMIEGVPVFGGREHILKAVEKYKIDQILFAIPTASPEEKRDILNICKNTSCELKSLPGLYQLANGEVSLSHFKPVAVEELLGRAIIKINLEEIFRQLKGQTILVTGGGGSIGSELCRQIAGHEPRQLIIFDVYENNAYDIEQELRHLYPQLDLVVLIGSVRDSQRLEQIFDSYRPDIVYHAAAHKHVPLMEGSPNEAIKNNVLGTYKTACAAVRYNAKRFVLISTDKAVNPTNIMGASKRLCEMVIQTMDAVSKAGRLDLLPLLAQSQARSSVTDKVNKSHLQIECVKNEERTGTQFVAVRFGNVLGSNGSVIPLFKKQIAEGGPVTVTHPDITRYFMTIPEAVSLVLQAGTYARGGEIFVLDMGEPVKIDTLARNLIRLSGYKPGVDIKIEYTGLRPGEKLFEEKLMAEEGLKKTDNELIHIGKPIPFDVDTFLGQMEELALACYENSDQIVSLVERMVPTFHPAGGHPLA